MPARRKSRSSPRRSKGSRSKSPRRVLKHRSSGKARTSRRAAVRRSSNRAQSNRRKMRTRSLNRRLTYRAGKTSLFSSESQESPSVNSLTSLHIVTGDRQGNVSVWNVENGDRLWTNSCGPNNDVKSVAFSPNGEHIVTGDKQGNVSVWNVENGDRLMTMSNNFTTRGVAFSPDGRRIVSGDDSGTVSVWNAETGQRMMAMEVVRTAAPGSIWKQVVNVAFSPDGTYIVSGDFSGNTNVWNVTGGENVWTNRGSDHFQRMKVVFSPDGKHIVSTFKRNVSMWNWRQNEKVRAFSPKRKMWDWKKNGDDTVYGVAWFPDGKLVTGDKQGKVSVWNAADGKRLGGMTCDPNVNSYAFSPDGKVVTGYTDGNVIVWNMMGARLREMKCDGLVESVAVFAKPEMTVRD